LPLQEDLDPGWFLHGLLRSTAGFARVRRRLGCPFLSG
jgi:hypothetical protein